MNQTKSLSASDEPLCSASLIYLAAPYSHDDQLIKQERFEAVTLAAARLMAAGVHVFSPITHTHPMALAADLPGSWQYWERYDTIMISKCSSLTVLMLDGWEESKGVAAEIAIAKSRGLPVTFILPNA